MAAGIHGSESVTVTIDDGPGGSGQIFTTYVTGEVAAEIVSEMQDITTLGDTERQNAPVGMLNSPNFTVSGIWDTTASTSPHVVLLAPDNGPQDSSRTIVLVYGDGKTATSEAYLNRYKVSANVGALNTFEGEFTMIGQWAWSG